jgi:hypothetical protein
MGRLTRLVLTAALALTASIIHLVAAPPRAGNDAIQRFLEKPAAPHQYRATRRLEASGVGREGWLEARTSYAPETGFRYEVTSEGGSGYIRSHVLHSLLEEERHLIASGQTAAVAITIENYRLTPDGADAAGLSQVVMTPLRKERALIAGRMFLTPDGELTRVEGRLAKNPSFWTTRVDLERSYARVNGVVMPVSLQSTAQLRLFGRSTLHMTYTYLEIDARPVVSAPQL